MINLSIFCTRNENLDFEKIEYTGLFFYWELNKMLLASERLRHNDLLIEGNVKLLEHWACSWYYNSISLQQRRVWRDKVTFTLPFWMSQTQNATICHFVNVVEAVHTNPRQLFSPEYLICTGQILMTGFTVNVMKFPVDRHLDGQWISVSSC